MHSLHHNHSNPPPWSGMAMHPVATILSLSVVLIHRLMSLPLCHLPFDLPHTAPGGAGSQPAGEHKD